MRKGELRCGAADCGAIKDEKEFKRCLDATRSKRGKKTLRCNDCVAKEEAELLEIQKKNQEQVMKRRRSEGRYGGRDPQR